MSFLIFLKEKFRLYVKSKNKYFLYALLKKSFQKLQVILFFELLTIRMDFRKSIRVFKKFLKKLSDKLINVNYSYIYISSIRKKMPKMPKFINKQEAEMILSKSP